MEFLFTSDLHGREAAWERLFGVMVAEAPAAVLLGGDLLPGGSLAGSGQGDFVQEYVRTRLGEVRDRMGDGYPRVLLIPGNDDAAAVAAPLFEEEELWTCIHGRRVEVAGYPVYGYAFVPPTPFLLKDWERYDVSRYVDPGCVPPEEGLRSVPVEEAEIPFQSIRRDLDDLVGRDDLENAVVLFHAPPYDTRLDRAALDGKTVDHVPVDPHVGSIAIRRFIEARQPLVTLHGHVHESASLTGDWRDRIGRTWMFSGCSPGGGALVRFDPGDLEASTREEP